MQQKLSQNVTYWLGVIAVGLVVGLSLQFVRAWSEPTVAPPGGNVGAPINTSNNGQSKDGPLLLNPDGDDPIGLTVNRNLNVLNGNVGIGIPADLNQRLNVNGNIKTSGQLFTNNYGNLPNGWNGIHTWDVHARASIRTNSLCLGGGFNGDATGDCRSSWPGGGSITSCRVCIKFCTDPTGNNCGESCTSFVGAGQNSWSGPAVNPTGDVDAGRIYIECQ